MIFTGLLMLNINGFSQTFKDSETALAVCSYQTIHFNSSEGSGLYEKEFFDEACFPVQFKETNSTWLKWQASEKV